MSLVLHDYTSTDGVLTRFIFDLFAGPAEFQNILGFGQCKDLSLVGDCNWWLRTKRDGPLMGSLEGVGSFPADWLNRLGKFWEMTPLEVHRAVQALRQDKAA